MNPSPKNEQKAFLLVGCLSAWALSQLFQVLRDLFLNMIFSEGSFIWQIIE